MRMSYRWLTLGNSWIMWRDICGRPIKKRIGPGYVVRWVEADPCP
jgi:hypothetical protein